MTTQAEVSPWLTTQEIAAHYRRPVATIRYWRHTGYGPKGVRAGTAVLYARAEVERFDAELAEQAASGRTA